MIIHRDYNRTKHDDFILNVEPRMRNTDGAFEITFEDVIVGWVIKSYTE